MWRTDDRLEEQVSLQVEVQAKYSGYLKRQTDEIDRQQHNEELRLPLDIDYAEVGGLSNEARHCLTEVRPATLGQAARIRGSPRAAVSLLLVHLKKASPRRVTRRVRYFAGARRRYLALVRPPRARSVGGGRDVAGGAAPGRGGQRAEARGHRQRRSSSGAAMARSRRAWMSIGRDPKRR